MFVLRSHEGDSESAPQPASGSFSGSFSVNAHDGGSAWPAPVDLAAAREARGPDVDVAAHCKIEMLEGRTADPGRQPGVSMQMPLFAAAFAVRFGGAKVSSECPKRLADVEGLIDRVNAAIDRGRDRIPWERAELVHALLDDARMLLDGARRNHEQPIGPYDHARAFAKADAALGHARAAQVVCSRWTQE